MIPSRAKNCPDGQQIMSVSTGQQHSPQVLLWGYRIHSVIDLGRNYMLILQQPVLFYHPQVLRVSTINPGNSTGYFYGNEPVHMDYKAVNFMPKQNIPRPHNAFPRPSGNQQHTALFEKRSGQNQASVIAKQGNEVQVKETDVQYRKTDTRQALSIPDAPENQTHRIIADIAFFCCSINDESIDYINQIANDYSTNLIVDSGYILCLISEALEFNQKQVCLNRLADYEQKIVFEKVDVLVKRFCLLMANGLINYNQFDIAGLKECNYPSLLDELKTASDQRVMNTGQKALNNPDSKLSIDLTAKLIAKDRAERLRVGLLEAKKKKAMKKNSLFETANVPSARYIREFLRNPAGRCPQGLKHDFSIGMWEPIPNTSGSSLPGKKTRIQ